MMQGSQILLAVNMPFLLALGFVVAVVLLVMGYSEKQLPKRANTLFRAGLVLLGVMTAITPVLWYWSWALPSGTLLMSLPDLSVLALGTLVGGIIIGTGLLFRLRK